MAIEYFKQHGMLPDLSELDRLRDVPVNAYRLARALADYDPNIYIIKLAEGHPQFDRQRPYSVVVHGAKDKYVLKNYAEWQLDERIMADIIQADVTNAGMSIDDVQAINAAHAMMKARERQEIDAERRELAKDVAKLGLSKNYARHNGKLLFDPNA
jgi:hypothetical protein